MTDLLTKEERKIVDRVRHRIREDEAWGDCDTDASELLAIIDNLSKRGVKKYSEDELLGWFKSWKTSAPIGQATSRESIVLAVARFLGALDAIVNEEV